ncbi:MAG: diguanylate cyclase [Xanthobacteraceae bacterium]
MRIVVVDPSRTILKAVSRLLEDDGHAVSAFSEGREALDYIKSAPDVSVLMTSAELATMSGLELCWEARLLSGRDRALYIILMSSNAEQSAVVNALDSGADEFIRKPPVREELYARLRTAERLLRQQRELIVLANLDSLTGAFNRRAFFEKTGDFAEAGRRFAAVMFDIDHFKDVNDTYGHNVGDQVLRVIGGEARRDKTILGRLGGEEFAIVLEGSSLEAATRYAEELRDKLAALSFESEGQTFSVTASFGVAERAAQESIDLLLKRADAALYQAKRGGRNRVIAATAQASEQEALWSNLLRGGKRGRGDPPSTSTPGSPQNAGTTVEVPSSAAESVTGQPSAATRAFVLDDELRIAAMVGKVLEAGGFAARTFTAIPQFFAEMKNDKPELVVLDLSLGEPAVVEIVYKLEADGYRGKVLLISGRDETMLYEIAQIGANHGLAMLPPLKKPFRPADVRQRFLAGQTVWTAEPTPPLADRVYQTAS